MSSGKIILPGSFDAYEGINEQREKIKTLTKKKRSYASQVRENARKEFIA
jgi:hypothetical protein